MLKVIFHLICLYIPRKLHYSTLHEILDNCGELGDFISSSGNFDVGSHQPLVISAGNAV